MSIIQGTSKSAAGGSDPFVTTLIPNSIWLDGAADFLERQNGSAFSNRKEVIISFWVQRNKFATKQAFFAGVESSAGFFLTFDVTTDKLFLSDGGSKNTTAVYRDIGWYHLLISYDTSQVVATDRTQLYVNGVQVTSFSTAGTVGLNSNIAGISGAMTGAENMRIGAYNNTEVNLFFFNGYIAQACMLESVSLQQGDFAVSDFLDTFTYGTNGSQFVPKANADIATLASTAGGNSFCLDFADSSDLGNDISSNNNDFSPTSMAAVNQSGNTPSLVYPVFNPLAQVGTGTGTLSEGNTKVVLAADNGITATQTIPSTGLWYWEMDWTAGANGIYPGVCVQSAVGNTASSPHARTDTWVWLAGDSQGRVFNGSSLDAYVGSATAVGKIAVCFDADNTAMYFGTISSTTITWLDSGDPTSGSSKTGAAPFTSLPTDETVYIFQSTGDASTVQYLFDEDDWTGATNRPAAALALSSANVTAPEFQGKDFFDTTLYEGNGQNQRVGDFVPFTDSFNVAKSAMFDDGDRRYLARTYSASDTARSSNSQATISYWIKFNSTGGKQDVLTTSNSGQTLRLRHYIDDQSGQKKIYMTLDGPSTDRDFIIPSGVLSDQEWTHILYHLDVDNSTAANKVKCFVNGVQQTSTSTAYEGASNADYFLFANEEHFVGNLAPAAAGYTGFCLNSYLAELNVLDGQLKAPGDFGEVDTSTNRWIPKDYDTNVGVYGNRGFYMEFLNPTGTGNGVGTDSSGNSFNFTESFVSGGSAWAATDQFLDTPSQNYATLDPGRAGSSAVLAQGNLKQTAVTDHNVQATMTIPKSGKWAFTGNIDALDFSFGVVSEQNSLTVKIGRTATSWGIIESSGANMFQVEHNSAGSFNLGSQPSVNHKLIAAIDMDLGHLWLGFNTGSGFTFFGGGNPATGATPTYQGVSVSGQRLYFAIGRQLSASFGGQSATLNGALPTGFLELNQDNLDDTQSKLTAWAWIKNRDATDNHMLFDRIRGVGNDLHSNTSAVQTFNANTVQRFLQRGVQVGSDVEVNTANESYVLWQWLLGDSATTGTAISADNPPTIASTNLVADSGAFGMCTYTGNATAGATVQHSLGGVPDMIMFKRFGATVANWVVYFKELGAGNSDYLMLDVNIAEGGAGAINWLNSTAATSTLVTLGNDGNVNASDTYIMYLFRNVPGVCKVGTYTGNGNNNGPYVSVGFSPRYILVRSTSATRSWNALDTARNPFNIASPFVLLPDSTLVDTAGQVGAFDILADGFKPRDTAANTNGSGEKYMYLAMADIGGNGTLPPIYGK